MCLAVITLLAFFDEAATATDSGFWPVTMNNGSAATLRMIDTPLMGSQVIVIVGREVVAGTPEASLLSLACSDDALAHCEVYDFETRRIYTFAEEHLTAVASLGAEELYPHPRFASGYSERPARLSEVVRFELEQTRILAFGTMATIVWVLAFSIFKLPNARTPRTISRWALVASVKVAAMCLIAGFILAVTIISPISIAGFAVAIVLSGLIVLSVKVAAMLGIRSGSRAAKTT
jgi:hypothetical protein